MGYPEITFQVKFNLRLIAVLHFNVCMYLPFSEDFFKLMYLFCKKSKKCRTKCRQWRQHNMMMHFLTVLYFTMNPIFGCAVYFEDFVCL